MKDECPDPANQTPANMRAKSSLPDSADADDLEASYYLTLDSIDGVAAAASTRVVVRGSKAGW